jgi:hypothetical protein
MHITNQCYTGETRVYSGKIWGFDIALRTVAYIHSIESQTNRLKSTGKNVDLVPLFLFLFAWKVRQMCRK